MQAQDTTTLYLLKLWPKIEAKKNWLIAVGVVAVLAVFIIWFMMCQRQAKEIAAGQALTQVALSGPQATAATYLKIAEDHRGTIAGQRALLQGAAAQFAAGKFADAQIQFQKFLDAHSDSEFSGQAALGVAASLEAQGKTDLAVGAYQRAINSSSDVMIIGPAKFALGRIDEAQGKFNDAMVLYQDVARGSPGSSLASEATMRMMELRSKIPVPAPAPAAKPAVPSLKTGP